MNVVGLLLLSFVMSAKLFNFHLIFQVCNVFLTDVSTIDSYLELIILEVFSVFRRIAPARAT